MCIGFQSIRISILVKISLCIVKINDVCSLYSNTKHHLRWVYRVFSKKEIIMFNATPQTFGIYSLDFLHKNLRHSSGQKG